MAIIAHASINENGKVSGGQLGDQSRKEVCTRSWYAKPWGCVIRFKDAGKREKIAQLMERAAANDHIGYDQSRRNTLLNAARRHNYDVSKVVENCATDCSALVSLACMYAGVPESVLVNGGNSATTRTIRRILEATGLVDIYTTAMYTAKSDKLVRGDILLKEGAHVVVVIQPDKVNNNNPYLLSESLLERGSKGQSVKWLQWQLNAVNGANLDVDGEYGEKTEKAVTDYQKAKGLEVDGIAGKQTLGSLKA